MNIEIKAPSPGESISELEIAQLLAGSGDYVDKNQIIAELDTDKATLEVVAEDSGVINFAVSEGDVINVGDLIATIDSSHQKPVENTVSESAIPSDSQTAHGSSPITKAPLPTPTPVSLSTTGTRPGFATQNLSTPSYSTPKPVHTPIPTPRPTPSPAARKILAEKNVPAHNVNGTGRDGRITKYDAIQASVPSMGTPPEGVERNSTKTRLSSLRRKVAQRLVSVKNETAMLTTFNEVDMHSIFDIRSKYKDEFLQKHQVKLGFMSFFTKAVVKALQEFPEVNSMIDNDQKITYGFCDISIAVSGPKGLMVPVIRNAELLSFAQIEQEVVRLATKARNGKLTIDEMTGGTFTITNGGVFGSMLSTPIINPPQSAILGMHNIIQRPVVVNKEIVIRPMMYLAVSYDHRIIDGRESVGFLVAIKEGIENPEKNLMNGNLRQALEL